MPEPIYFTGIAGLAVASSHLAGERVVTIADSIADLMESSVSMKTRWGR